MDVRIGQRRLCVHVSFRVLAMSACQLPALLAHAVSVRANCERVSSVCTLRRPCGARSKQQQYADRDAAAAVSAAAAGDICANHYLECETVRIWLVLVLVVRMFPSFLSDSYTRSAE